MEAVGLWDAHAAPEVPPPKRQKDEEPGLSGAFSAVISWLADGKTPQIEHTERSRGLDPVERDSTDATRSPFPT